MKFLTYQRALFFVLPFSFLLACRQNVSPKADWKNSLEQEIPLLGHRNWIVIADQAFPQQTAPGISYINTGEHIAPVLKHVLASLKSAGHVSPQLYRDREMAFLTPALSPGVEAFRASIKSITGHMPVQEMLHDSVFAKLAASSGQFRVLVLKTNEKIAYSSILLELDCAYWNAKKEAVLRGRMQSQ